MKQARKDYLLVVNNAPAMPVAAYAHAEVVHGAVVIQRRHCLQPLHAVRVAVTARLVRQCRTPLLLALSQNPQAQGKDSPEYV